MVISMNSLSDLLDEKRVAEKLGITAGTLRNWRVANRGPRWATNPDSGRFIGYTVEAVDSYIAQAIGTAEVAS